MMIMRIRKKGISGFTLIELMLVVVIIGILSALAISRYSAATEKAKYSGARLWLKRIYQALETYYAENGCYPPDVNRNVAPNGLVAGYLEKWPNPVQDALNSVYDYENQEYGGARAVGVTYLGKDLLHSHHWLWAFENCRVGEIAELPGSDDLFIVAAKGVSTCESGGSSLPAR